MQHYTSSVLPVLICFFCKYVYIRNVDWLKKKSRYLQALLFCCGDGRVLEGSSFPLRLG